MSDAKRPTWRKFLPLLALPAVGGPLFVFAFVVRTQRAHDESQCPYKELSRRTLVDGAIVVEERRSCLPNVEDRRYVLRRGKHVQVLGRRLFDSAAFAAPEYGWDAGVSDGGEVHIHIDTPGHESAFFREGRPDER